MPKIDPRAFQLLGEMVRPPRPPKATAPHDDGWMPDLNPTQLKAWNCNAKYLLMHGPKGGSKSHIAVEKLMKHAYENQNAFALILVRTQNMAKKGGAWDMLISQIVPEWREGLGLQITEVKSDKQHYEFIWVENMHGGWSMIAVMSAPHANQLRERIRGMVPSMVFVDELTSTPSHEYFQSVAAQLGRRPGVEGVQQYLAACNPDGPSHWVYHQFFEIPFDEVTGEWDDDFEVIFFPREENRHRMQEGYFEGLKKIYKGDVTEGLRMEEGEWIDRPSGEALFGEIYNPMLHCAPLLDGKPDLKRALMPSVNFPMAIGMDPGQVFNAFIFQQYLPIGGLWKWVIFDELVSVRKRISYPDFMPMVMRRIRWWRDLTQKEIPVVWISDLSAFNQYRAATGSFDVMDLEKIYEANRAKYKLERMKIKGCPKPAGSVVARTRMGQTLLAEDRVLVSSRCQMVHKMFLRLEGKKTRPGEPFDADGLLTPQRSDYIHTWDALSYVWLKASIDPMALVPHGSNEQSLLSSAA